MEKMKKSLPNFDEADSESEESLINQHEDLAALVRKQNLPQCLESPLVMKRTS
jgi:hypothetical protein